jgi:hypothetical protein
VTPLPLGDYSEFVLWSGRPREGDGWRVWFGGQVIDGLCGVLDEHLAARRPDRSGAQPAAIGCVPWLTSDDIARRLVRFGSCCIAVDKGAKVNKHLLDHGRPFPNSALRGLEWTMPAGQETLLGPSAPMPEHDLGPIRVVGWQQRGDGWKPLLHAKLLVLGQLEWVTYSPDDAPEFESWEFTPQSVWLGSSNWTTGSSYHLEAGFWSTDEHLARHATAFVSDVITFSEPIDSTCAAPEPNLVAVEFDDEAMAEAARDLWLDDGF